MSPEVEDPLAALRRANDAYAKGFALGELPMRARTDLTILACGDSRMDPAHFLSLEAGAAYVFRNAGGRVTDDFLRLLLITQVLGCRRVMVIHHTDCGLNRFTNDGLHARIQKELGLDSSHVDFLPYADLEQSVRDDVATLRNSSVVRNDVSITGHVYDVKSGRMHDVPTS
jgi:carbonic anhydrase